MAKFAVYIIPPAETTFYQRGSDILGYDVRQGVFLPEDNPTRAALPAFDNAWVQRPQVYGFHVTTGYSLYFERDRLPEIEAEIENVIGCMTLALDYVLTPDPDERIPFWNGDIVVLRYHPNAALSLLHTLLVARVNPYGTASNISWRLDALTDDEIAALDPVYVRRVRQYYTPYIFDGWTPHFTLMQPYTGTQPGAMRAALADLFAPVPVPVTSICLLLMEDNETHYRLYREFPLISG